MERFTNDYVVLATYVARKDFQYARRMMEKDGVTPTTIVPRDLFKPAVELAFLLYAPTDKGRYGKNGEAQRRVELWLAGGRKWAHWSEFFARKSGRGDIGENTENKTGAGDWLYSTRTSNYERIIAEYWKKTSFIRWATESFCIECEWNQLFDYLNGYNDKGITTWFNRSVKYNATVNKSVVKMQEFKTSKKKIRYLQACPYNSLPIPEEPQEEEEDW